MRPNPPNNQTDAVSAIETTMQQIRVRHGRDWAIDTLRDALKESG